MEIEVSLDKHYRNIESFKFLLEKYNGYTTCTREIKINSILGKKCQFDIESINPPMVCNFPGMLKSVSEKPTINKISFIIDTDLSIISLTVNLDITDSKVYQTLKTLTESALSFGSKIEIKPKIQIHNNNLQVFGFYLEMSKF